MVEIELGRHTQKGEPAVGIDISEVNTAIVNKMPNFALN